MSHDAAFFNRRRRPRIVRVAWPQEKMQNGVTLSPAPGDKKKSSGESINEVILGVVI